MKNLKFQYHLKIAFEQPVKNHRFTVKCVPKSDEKQQITNLKLSILPKESLSEEIDSFGNHCIFGSADEPHSLFEVVMSGEARTGLADAVKAEETYRIGMFRSQSPLTIPGEAIRSLYQELSFEESDNNRVKSQKIMELLRKHFTYVSGSTGIHTKAEEALEQGCGVCQDYSHIMISLCRMAGIAARYVVGMLIGEGLSHAWVEIEEDGFWYGFDPTNDKYAGDEHIKISHGRDYADCLLNQGLFTGDSRQFQTISVQVEEIGETET